MAVVVQSAHAVPLFTTTPDHRFYPIIRVKTDGTERREDCCFTCNEPESAHQK